MMIWRLTYLAGIFLGFWLGLGVSEMVLWRRLVREDVSPMEHSIRIGRQQETYIMRLHDAGYRGDVHVVSPSVPHMMDTWTIGDNGVQLTGHKKYDVGSYVASDLVVLCEQYGVLESA